MRKIDKNNLSIAVIGRSMTGKTTWITSLFKKDINVDLRRVCLENSEGQTKLKIWYELKAPDANDGISLKEILFFREDLEEAINKGGSAVVDKMKGFGIDIDRDALESCGAQTFKLALGEKEIDTGAFFRELVNDMEAADSGLFQRITISVPAAPEVWDAIREYGLERVAICDTRGMMDETDSFEDEIKKISRLSDSKDAPDEAKVQDDVIIKKLLNERGVSEADACVFMTEGGKELRVKKNKEKYGFLFRHISTAMPIFVTSLSGILSSVLERRGGDTDYGFYSGLMETDRDLGFLDNDLKYELGCKPVRELIDEFHGIDPDAGHAEAGIYRDNVKALLLARIDTENKDQHGLYLKSAHWAFRKVLEEAYDFKAQLAEFEEKTLKLPETLKEGFREAFKEQFVKDLVKRGNITAYIRLRGVNFTGIYMETVRKGYYGGLVGKNGGMTTWVPGYGRTGQYAISLLEAAYNEFERIGNQICDKAPSEDYRVKCRAYLSRMLNCYSFSYSCTGMMLWGQALYEAWKYTNERMGEDGKGLSYDFLSEYDMSVSVVYCMMDRLLWNVIDHVEKSGVFFNDQI